MRLAYFDCFAGITGGMALAALVHAGADLDRVTESVAWVPSAGFDIEREPVDTLGIAALRLHVQARADTVIRTYASIRATLEEAPLSDRVRWASQRAFRLLAEADARVQSREVDLVTFHESGDIDPILGIVGTTVALEDLGVNRVFASPIPTGLGMARTDHGMVPIPSPVVVSLLQGAPTYSRGIPVDLVTPLGAALMAALAEGYGDMPMMRTEVAGYGAGTLRLDFPHVLRVVIGTEERAASGAARPAEGLVLLLAPLPVDPPEARSVVEDVLAEGALDAWASPAFRAGGDIAALVQVIVHAENAESVLAVLRRHGSGEVRMAPLRDLPPA